jgi:acyl-CoA thioesterase FadM
MDALGHVNNAQVLTYFEDQRNERFYRHNIIMDSSLGKHHDDHLPLDTLSP